MPGSEARTESKPAHPSTQVSGYTLNHVITIPDTATLYGPCIWVPWNLRVVVRFRKGSKRDEVGPTPAYQSLLDSG